MERVRVYRNLRDGGWSVQAKTKKGWRVVDIVNEIHLTDVKFIISKKGQERVRRERKKYVHAYVEGIVCSPRAVSLTEMFYNPYKVDEFCSVPDLTPVTSADYVKLGWYGVCEYSTYTINKQTAPPNCHLAPDLQFGFESEIWI